MTQNDRSTRNRITDIRAITFGSARRSGKAASSTTRRRRNAVMLMTLLPGLVWASELPTGGSIVSGSGNIARNDNTLTITQNSNTLITNWQDFSIGAGNTVNFVQPGSASIALNRVLGNDASRIFGSLNANGRVFLVNANGVLFGRGASVDVGALVASTLNISDSDFLNGNYLFSGNGGTVHNEGNLRAADGGAVLLLGGRVSNEGVIEARLGSVALAAGGKVALDFAGDGLFSVKVDEAVLDALVGNHGAIRADGGSVLLTADAGEALLQTVVNNTGVIEARTLEDREGKIILLGGFGGGVVKVGGTLDASAPGGGNGGFIETSGAHVQIADDATVTTRADNGKSGVWLIDPNDFTIAQSGGNMTGAQVGNALDNNGNFIIQTATMGTAGGSGDINVNDVVNWSGNSTLTLQAERSVNVNAAITATGNGAGLVVDYNQGSGITDGNFYVNATVNLPVTGSLAINGQAYTLITSLAGLSNPNGYYALVQDSSAAITATLGNLTGTLEGLGHRVSGININAASDQYVGLFNTLNQGSVVRNLSIDGSVTGNRFVGLLAAVNQGTVVNVHSSGSVNSSTGSAGGLVYGNGAQIGGGNYVAGVIDRSSSSATVTSAASNSVGGLVGSNSSLGIISNSYATGNVSSSQIVGGLAGTNAGTIVNSYATGNVSALPNGFAGGLVGSNNGDISFSYATGSVTGSARIGGLVGHNFGGSISNSYATGAVSGTSYVGGLVGINQGDLSNSYWDSYTTGQSDAVGYQPVGTATNVSAVTSDPSQSAAANYAFRQSAYANFDFGSDWFMVEGSSRPLLRAFLNQADSNGLIAVTNLYQLQGMAANLSGHYLLTQDIDASATAASTVLADVWGGQGFAAIGTAASKFTGSFDGQGHVIDGLTINRGAQDNVGLFGYAGDGAVFANVGLRNADITGRAFVGTLLGQGGNTDAVAIDNAWSSGTVTSTSTLTTQGAIGGLVGGMSGTIANSHSSATVTGNNRVGGLVGQMSVDSNASKIQQISNSYATGDVSATFGYGGGLVGRNFARIANSYATGNVSGGTVLGGLVGYGSIATYWNSQTDPNTQDSYLNVYASGNVTGTGNDVGGLFGLTQGIFKVHNAFATGNVVGAKNVGGLIGRLLDGGSSAQQASLWSVYTQGGTVTGQDNVGGLIGSSGWVHVTNSYSASGLLTATDSNAKLGGLIGGNNTALSANIFIFENGVWNIETTGTDFAIGDNAWGSFFITAPSGTQYLASGHTVGATTAQMMTVEPYAVSGFNNGQGGLVGYSIVTAANAAGNDYSQLLYSNNIYFLYEGQTYPLLRAFLQKVTVNATPDFDGTTTSLTNIGSATLTGVPNFDHIYGTALFIQGDTLTLTSTQTDSYTATSNASVSGLWSDQFGYEIGYAPSARIISTPGSAAGDIQLPDSITWESGTLVIDTGGALITGGSGVNTTIISGDAFRLANGNWWQNNSTLAGFSVNDFQFAGGTFLRATRGSGDEGDAYRLADVYGLQGMASTALLDKHFTLVNDVDASGTAGWNGGLGFVPIGDSSDHFTGVLDGLGFTIDSLVIDRPAEDYVGLFGFLRGDVRNLGLVDASVSGRHRVGSLAGYSGGGSLRQVFTENADVTGTGDYVGGLVGVTAHGGGGIVQAWATGTVSGQQNFVGGLAGYAHSGSHIRQSWADVAVSGVNQVGGLLGYNKGTHMVDVQAYGDVTASGLYIGGLVGVLADAGTITNATASGRVSSSEHFVGGLVGYTYADSLIRNGLAEGEVSGLHRVGGLAGYNRGSLERVQAHGSVTATGTYIGGLVGVNAGHISQAWATGDVSTTTHYAGGLAGYTHAGSTVSDVRADGAVSGISRVGGLIGQHVGSLTNGLSTGAVTGSYYTGGLIGHDGGGSVTASFWDTQTSAQATSAGGIGLGTTQLRQIGTYNSAGWSISGDSEATTVWLIEDEAAYPWLRAFLSPL